MTPGEHEEHIRKIQAETEEIKRQILQLEFQNKKDIAAAQKRFDAWDEKITKKLNHIAQLVGITYEELDNLDLKTQEAGKRLSRHREHSTFS
jgi:hypothetical protein